MGCPNLILVNPKEFDMDRALPLATVKGKKVLERAEVVSNLPTALASFHKVYATTARMGGWRKGILMAEEAAKRMTAEIESGAEIAIVFGPEDTGLTNEEIEICGSLISIPTMPDAWSLNLAQAVLIILYECFKLKPTRKLRPIITENSRLATHEELLTLYTHMQQALLDIDFLRKDNPDYFMMPLKRFMNRLALRRNEFNLLMGVCRQIRWLKSQVDKSKSD
jgi:tRNA/rRNA methyltransferase